MRPGPKGLLVATLLLAGCIENADVLSTRDGGALPDLGRDRGADLGAADAFGPRDFGVHDAGAPVIGGGRTLAAATAHTCAIGVDGLYCWGRNDYGQLGNGELAESNAPVRVQSDARFEMVVALADHTCAIDDRGTLYCWGRNDVGQLGTGDRRGRTVPTVVPLLEPAVAVDVGQGHTCAILTGGALHCWGRNDEGQLGITPVEQTEALAPTRVGTAATWVRVSAGQGHTCGLRGNTAWCWGRNSSYELGLGSGAPLEVRAPTRVAESLAWRALAAGQSHGCGLGVRGESFCWGDNSAFQLGTGDLTTRPEPVLSDPGPWSDIDTDTFHGCVTAAGALACWGRNAEGQLGTGDLEDRRRPTLLPAPSGGSTSWSEASTGRFHTCARDVLGDVYCTGANDHGQLGTGDQARRRELTLVLRVSPI